MLSYTYGEGNVSSSMSVVGKGSENRLKIYNYDSFNQLTAYYDALSSASYTYNADGLRMSKTVNGTKTEFTWDGQNLAGEETGDSLNTYTYDVTGISSAVIDGVYRTYMKDTHGSVVGYYNATGERMKQYDYDAFGNRLEGSDPDPFGYCGEYYDSESGNIYLRARYYNSETGRFISEDPAKDGVNWYVYCGGDPILYVDPFGTYPIISGEGTYVIDGINYRLLGNKGVDLAEIEPSMELYQQAAEELQSSDTNLNAILGFSHEPQIYTNLCWATGTSMAVKYLTGKNISKEEIAKDGATQKDKDGIRKIDMDSEAWFNIPMTYSQTARLINNENYLQGYTAVSKEFSKRQDENAEEELVKLVKNEIDNQRPVLWFNANHVSVIVGYAGNQMILDDPSFENNYIVTDDIILNDNGKRQIVYFEPNNI